ncbi:uncharacterized protein G2W53_017683 [Senna tora]|uniref:Uncharacterized protein n=1 Tax=Senna tora TaxID=362788 RepID=A0A834WR03_9FABA|nr:uncharacterized protein G2W53_017683 [Senna tora]
MEAKNAGTKVKKRKIVTTITSNGVPSKRQ